MYPVGASAALPDELVNGWQGLEEVEVLATFLHRWQIYVGRLATHVLAAADSSHCLVKFRTPIPAVYADGAEAVAQWLQYHVAQVS